VPALFPDAPVDELLAGREVPDGAIWDGLWRLAAGLALLPAGAWLFSRRQIGA
jgi:hypothetical protein